MKLYLLTLSFLFSSICVNAQVANCPPNIDFEAGDFTNWQCFTGTTFVNAGVNIISLTPSPPTPIRHEIVTLASGNDSYGGFPKLCPYGGQYSVKLGNSNTGSEAEGISYTFQIPLNADTFSLTYYYAVVFEDPGHIEVAQPRFFVSAYDVLTGNLINCASYNYIADGAIPGFVHSTLSNTVLYKDWTPASIDFSGLAGRNVRVEFKTADCTQTGHFGYGYVDVGTGCGGLIAAGAYCVSTNSATLNAPFGFASYKWYDDTYSTLIGTTRAVTISPPPPLNSIFHVDMVPYPGFGCRDTADAFLQVLPVPDTPVIASNIYYCQFDNAQPLTAAAVSGNQLLWYTTATGGIPSFIAPTPNTSLNGSFDFYVSQKKLFGCESSRKKITVSITPSPIVSFTINNTRQCFANNNYTFTSNSTNVNAGSLYQWDFGDGSTTASTAGLTSVTHTYTTIGNYTVKLKIQNAQNCFRELSKTITVVPNPIADFSFPPIICENQTPIVLQDNSTVPSNLSTINYWWWSISGSIITNQNPATFTSIGGSKTVKLVVKNSDGCKSDTTSKIINILNAPMPKFSISNLRCENELIQFTDQSFMPQGSGTDQVIKWTWFYDNLLSSNMQNPSTNLSVGTHSIKLITESSQGCNYRNADSIIIIYPKPAIALTISDSCVKRDIIYAASSLSGLQVDKWYWNFGNGLQLRTATEVKRFYTEGYNPVTLIGQTVNNCKDTLIRPFIIYYNRSKAIRDTIVATDEILQLNTIDTINMLSYIWSPNIGLSSTIISNPLATHMYDQAYELNTLTVQGCDAKSKILVRRYDGPELYVPSAFTPNKDGKNDFLKVIPVGIKSFTIFSVYNRFGQLMFSTTDYNKGWDGYFKGVKMDPANYVWYCTAVDYRGKLMFRKGNVLLIR
jgi:gliding motility-associated-like protein